MLGLEVRTRSRQVKSRIGVQLQSSSYYDYLTPLRDYLPPRQLLSPAGLTPNSAGTGGTGRPGQELPPPIVRRTETAIRCGGKPGQLARARDPGRAHHRPRPPGQAQPVGPGAQHPGTRRYPCCSPLTTWKRRKPSATASPLWTEVRLLAVDSVENLVRGVKAAYSVKLVLSRPLDTSRFSSLGVDITQMETGEAITYVPAVERRRRRSQRRLERDRQLRPRFGTPGDNPGDPRRRLLGSYGRWPAGLTVTD